MTVALSIVGSSLPPQADKLRAPAITKLNLLSLLFIIRFFPCRIIICLLIRVMG